jgi:hypothetical protein
VGDGVHAEGGGGLKICHIFSFIKLILASGIMLSG